ncbi:MAG TPA: hypothetical protein VFB36_15595 [Nevskiaceae bacterium]|nr:hypothetical protein [Nevskiaceae bacterium]
MAPQVLVPALMVPLFGFVLYRRVRRNIGRQPLKPSQLKARMAILAFATLMIVMNFAKTADLQLAMALGALPGLALALWGVKLAHIESTPQGVFYTPNPYLGIAISILLIGRIVYRMVQMGPMMQSPQAMSSPAAMYTPLTMALFGLVIGYYVAYCAGLLWRARENPQAA